MDPITLFIIFTIIAAISLLALYRQQENRVTSNLHNHNLKQLLTITAIEHKVSRYNVNDEKDLQAITHRIDQLVNKYEKGDIHADVVQQQIDHLINQIG